MKKGKKLFGLVSLLLIAVFAAGFLGGCLNNDGNENPEDTISIKRTYALVQCATIEEKLATSYNVLENLESYSGENWRINDPDRLIDPQEEFGKYVGNGTYQTKNRDFVLSLSGDISQSSSDVSTCEYILEELKKYLKDNNLEADSEISAKVTLISGEISSLKDEIKQLFGLIENTQQILKVVSGQNETLIAQNDSLIDQNETLTGQNDALIAQNDLLKTQNETLIDQNDTLAGQNELLNNQNETLIGQNETLIGQNKSIGDQLQLIVEQNALLSKSIENLNLANSSLDKRVEELTNNNTQLSLVILTLTQLIQNGSGENNQDAINALIAERDNLVEQINALIKENSDLQAQLDAATDTKVTNESEGIENNYKLIDGKFAIRLGYWEAARTTIKSIAVAAYGDTQIFKVETLASSGVYVDASTCLVANKCYYTGALIWIQYNEKSTIRVTTDSGVYIIEVALEKEYVNNYEGMQYNWDSFIAFYQELNSGL